MNYKKILSIILILVISSSLFGCANQKPSKPAIWVSIEPQITFVEKVAGDKFEVFSIVPKGASPKSYEPSAQQIAKSSEAVLYFGIGVPMEEAKVFSNITSNTKIIHLEKHVAKTYDELTIDIGRDPHIWLSIKRVVLMIEKIRDELIIIDPDNAQIYESNAKNYINELNQADLEIKAKFKDKSLKKPFFVFHPSFGYLADDLSLQMIALEDGGKEAAAKQLAEMVDLANKYKIDTVFYQNETSKRPAETFAGEINGKAVLLDPLNIDYIENLKNITNQIYEAVCNE